MQVIVCANQKGGVGKTATSAHLAFMAAEVGHQVLAIDFDPQCTLSRDLHAGFEKGMGEASLLFGRKAPKPIRLLTLPKPKGTLDLIGADDGLREVERSPKVEPAALRESLRSGAYVKYGVCVIDPPPTLGKPLEAALIAADGVVMPFVPTRQGIDGLNDLMETVERIKHEHNPTLKIIGLLPSLVNVRSSHQMQTLEDLRGSVGEMLMPVSIASRTSIADALGEGVPVWRHSSGQSQRDASDEVRRACSHILLKALT